MGFFKTVRSTHNMTTRHGNKVSERIPTGETGKNLRTNSNNTVIRHSGKNDKPIKAHKRK
ncbi:MAG: hypothetical protein JWO67_4526 [Streptosporangiaceae bacterium]|nr:hypothetical protein [Streptosporangiaceae bacterium]